MVDEVFWMLLVASKAQAYVRQMHTIAEDDWTQHHQAATKQRHCAGRRSTFGPKSTVWAE